VGTVLCRFPPWEIPTDELAVTWWLAVFARDSLASPETALRRASREEIRCGLLEELPPHVDPLRRAR